MEDVAGQVSGNKMAQLKSDMAELKLRIKKSHDKDDIARMTKKLRELETHYNILADRQRLSH